MDWYIGESRNRKGLVAAAFVRIISDIDISSDSVRALVIKTFVSRNELELNLVAGTLGILKLSIFDRLMFIVNQ